MLGQTLKSKLNNSLKDRDLNTNSHFGALPMAMRLINLVDIAKKNSRFQFEEHEDKSEGLNQLA